MADLIMGNTDDEVEKYEEAYLIASNPPPMDSAKSKTLNFNRRTGKNDVLLPLSSGGYAKVGEEPIPRVDQVKKYARELQGMNAPFDMADYDAAGFTAEEVQAAGIMPVQAPTSGRSEPMTEGETLIAQRQGDEILQAGPDQSLFEGAVSEVTKGLVRGGLVRPSQFLKENLNVYDPLVFQIVDPVTGEFDPQLKIVSREEKAEIDRKIEAGEMPYAVDFERLVESDPESGAGAQVAGSFSQFLGAFAGVGKLFRLGSGATGMATQGVAADFLAFRGDEGRLTDLLLEMGVPENQLTNFFKTDPNDPDYVGRFKTALEGTLFGAALAPVLIGMGKTFRAIKDGDVVPEAARDAVAKGKDALGNAFLKQVQNAEARIAERGTGTTLYSGFDPSLITDPLFAYVGKRVGNPGNEAATTKISEISQGKKPKIEDLVQYFEEEHTNIHGRKLDPNVEEDFDIAAKAAANEVKYQMDEAVSGKGWYDSDVKKTFETLSTVPGLERLADDETLRIIWSAFAAPTSIGNKVDLNTRAATAAFLQYLKTGKVPVDPPMKGAVTEGIRGAGWGMKQKSVAAGMKVISHLIETKGPDGFADWWLSPHTLKELTEIRKAAGLSGGPSGLSGGKDSLHLGAMVLGDKTGRYSLNINGYQGTTKDIWFSRSYNRHFGDMRNPDGSVAGGPRNQTERRRMEEFTARMLDEIGEEGLTEQDAQAVLWFYEQNLFTDLGVTSRPGSFSEAAEKIQNELRSGVRAGDEAEVGVEQAGEGLTGFRSVSAPKRTVRSQRRGAGLGEEAPRPYSRGSGEGAEGDGLLVLTPDEQSQRLYEEAGISLPNIKEQPAAETAATYNSDMTQAMSGHEYGAQVEIKSAEELANARLFRTENGSGFAIKPDGDIVAVFQSKGETGSVGYSMIQAAVEAGGRKLDAFDTFLPGIYETAGFKPVARLPWNDEFSPPGWDKETFKKFNNGEPDVVFFVYDPNYFGGAADVPKFTDYDDAVAAQDAEIVRLKETIDGY